MEHETAFERERPGLKQFNGFALHLCFRHLSSKTCQIASEHCFNGFKRSIMADFDSLCFLFLLPLVAAKDLHLY